MATLKEIAERAGVGVSTVSEVLNGRYKETRRSTAKHAARIRAIAKELKYRPNSAAKAVHKGCFDCVAILQDDQFGRSHLPQQLLNGIHDALARQGKHVTFWRVSDDLVTDCQRLPKFLREMLVDGLLVNINTLVPPRMVELLSEYELPTVWMNSRQPGDCVRPDDYGAGRDLTEHLLSLGHGDIAYADFAFATVTRHYSKDDRYAGYAAAMTAAGRQPRLLATPQVSSGAEHLAWLRHWLATEGPASAYIGYNQQDLEVLWLAGQIPGERGPAFGVFADASWRSFPLHVMLLPEYESGQAAVEMLLAKLADPTRRFPELSLPFKLVPADGPPPVRPDANRPKDTFLPFQSP